MMNYVGVLNYPSLTISRNSTAPADNMLDASTQRGEFLFSPCSGLDQSTDVSETSAYNLLVLSCNGQYNVFEASTLSFINSVR